VDGIRGNVRRPAFAHAWGVIEPSVGQDFRELKGLLREFVELPEPKQSPGVVVSRLGESQ
jgi:hypothetical protein